MHTVVIFINELSCLDFPTKTDAQTWESLCKEIFSSGYFELVNVVLVDIREDFFNPNSWYSSEILEIFDHDFTNPYILRKINLFGNLEVEEYIVACPVRKRESNYIFPCYVSKEYNVASFGDSYMPGRFIFLNLMAEYTNHHSEFYIILAEEPGIAHTEPDFNVELHYLQIRMYVEPGKIVGSTNIKSIRYSGNKELNFRSCLQRKVMISILYAD